MIVFQNPGELDLLGALTFGANAKPRAGGSPIGQFGTGLKYALAVLLRHELEVDIWVGERHYSVGVRPHAFRGADLDLVTIDGSPQGFSTALGAHWELWMAYRELHSNSLDEGGHGGAVCGEASGVPGETLIAVRGAAFEAVHAKRWEFLLETRPIVRGEKVELHPAPNGPARVFFRGIKVGELGTGQGLFAYNILAPLQLTEDRTFKYEFEVERLIAEASLAAPRAVLERIATADPEVHSEGKMDYQHYGMPAVAPEAAALLVQLHEQGRVKNGSVKMVVAMWQREHPSEPEEARLTAVQEAEVEAALAFLRGLPFGFALERGDVKVTAAPRVGLLGFVKEGQIWLTLECLAKGGKYVAGTLLEEWLHLTKGVEDESRGMQNWLLDAVMTLGEELRAGAQVEATMKGAE